MNSIRIKKYFKKDSEIELNECLNSIDFKKLKDVEYKNTVNNNLSTIKNDNIKIIYTIFNVMFILISLASIIWLIVDNIFNLYMLHKGYTMLISIFLVFLIVIYILLALLKQIKFCDKVQITLLLCNVIFNFVRMYLLWHEFLSEGYPIS